MGTIHIELPPALLARVQLEMSPGDNLDGVVAEAVAMWLARRQQEKAGRDAAMKVLGDAGLVMDPERQRAFAESVAATLRIVTAPSRADAEAALAKLTRPLSEEIIALRGER